MPPNPPTPSVDIDRLRPSPVRGQLEPYSSRSPPGWRYVQTTDTPDEFKVLLPPGTASMYDYLLKLEAYELTKKSINWERLMQMRHLKDRMVRKCQRLSNVSPGNKKASRGEPFGFQTIIAPSDFRLKEMEKWFREQQKRVASSNKALAMRTDNSGAGPSGSRPPPQTTSSSKPPLLLDSAADPPPSNKGKQPSKPISVPPPSSQTLRSISLPVATPAAPPPLPPQIFSPPPLPVLLLSQREEYGLEPSLTDILAFESVERPPISEGDVPDYNEDAGSNTPDSITGEGASGGGQLRRRRSCIKRSSMSDLVKTVSWADGRELDKQISRYAAAAKQAQSSGTWSEVRTLYLEQIKGLESLQIQVGEGLEQLRTESEHLQRIEETVKHQRENLETTFKDFENKYSLFQGKLQQAISEAANSLATTNNILELDLPPINET